MRRVAWLRKNMTEIDMFHCNHCHVGHHEQPPTFQCKTYDNGGQLFRDDVIFFETIPQSLSIFNWHKPPWCTARESYQQRFQWSWCRLSLGPFVVPSFSSKHLTWRCVSITLMASFALPVETRIANFSCMAVMSNRNSLCLCLRTQFPKSEWLHPLLPCFFCASFF